MDYLTLHRPSVLRFLLLPILLVSSLGALPAPHGQTIQEPGMSPRQEPSRLAVVWTSADREVALNVAFMYTLNAKSRGWFDEVTLIVWGPSANLLAHDEELQDYAKRMAEEGVTLLACQACADSYGVAEDLKAIGVDVKYMGVPLTEMLQGGWKVLTF